MIKGRNIFFFQGVRGRSLIITRGGGLLIIGGGGRIIRTPSDRGGHRINTPSDRGGHRIHTPTDRGGHRIITYFQGIKSLNVKKYAPSARTITFHYKFKKSPRLRRNVSLITFYSLMVIWYEIM